MADIANMNLNNFQVWNSQGSSVLLRDLLKPVTLIVNIDCKIGGTVNHECKEWQTLYQKYQQRGFEILAFPCDQFQFVSDQGEHVTALEIQDDLAKRYNVTFPIMHKVNVNGDDADPLFMFLQKRLSGFPTNAIKWDFTKFLIVNGEPKKRYAPTTSPSTIESEIANDLEQCCGSQQQTQQPFAKQQTPLQGGVRNRNDSTSSSSSSDGANKQTGLGGISGGVPMSGAKMQSGSGTQPQWQQQQQQQPQWQQQQQQQPQWQQQQQQRPGEQDFESLKQRSQQDDYDSSQQVDSSIPSGRVSEIVNKLESSGLGEDSQYQQNQQRPNILRSRYMDSPQYQQNQQQQQPSQQDQWKQQQSFEGQQQDQPFDATVTTTRMQGTMPLSDVQGFSGEGSDQPALYMRTVEMIIPGTTQGSSDQQSQQPQQFQQQQQQPQWQGSSDDQQQQQQPQWQGSSGLQQQPQSQLPSSRQTVSGHGSNMANPLPNTPESSQWQGAHMLGSQHPSHMLGKEQLSGDQQSSPALEIGQNLQVAGDGSHVQGVKPASHFHGNDPASILETPKN